MTSVTMLRRTALTAAILLVTTFGSTSSAESPTDIADARFAALDGPMAGFVVRPGNYDMDATRVLADIPTLLDSVDGARAKAFVEAIAFPRSSSSPDASRQRATDLVAATFRDAGYDPQFQSVIHPRTGKDMPNVYAEVPGTQCSDKVLVVSAHYDAAGAGNPGADDDGTGMAGLFEIARALRSHPLPITIRLVAFSYEEDGLLGSFEMAAHDAAAGTDIVGAVSMDMLGFTKPDIDPLTGLPATYLALVADPASTPLAKAFGAAAYTYEPAFPAAAALIPGTVLPDIFRSDHAPFVLKGYQGLMATDTANFRNPNYHTVNDTLDTIDWEFLTGSIRTVLAGVATYASSDQNQDGVVDHCPDFVLPTTTTTVPPADVDPMPTDPTVAPTSTAPTDVNPADTNRPLTPIGTTPMGAHQAPVARPVEATPTYTG